MWRILELRHIPCLIVARAWMGIGVKYAVTLVAIVACLVLLACIVPADAVELVPPK